MTERLWPNGDALGKRLNCDDAGAGCAEIIGIVGDVKHNSLVDEAGYDLHYPCYHSYSKQTHFVARTQGDPMTLANPASNLAGLSRYGCLQRYAFDEVVRKYDLAIKSLGTAVSDLFGHCTGAGTAGIYGVMAYFVTQRTREIGVRIALGAQ